MGTKRGHCIGRPTAFENACNRNRRTNGFTNLDATDCNEFKKGAPSAPRSITNLKTFTNSAPLAMSGKATIMTSRALAKVICSAIAEYVEHHLDKDLITWTKR